jgi:hypothetical protein
LQTGAALAAGLALPLPLRASPEAALPNSIPGGLDLLGLGHVFHVFLPGTSPELATITDFNGVLGATDVLGSWTAEGFTPPPNTPLIFDADMRFMSGEYIGRDGRHHLPINRLEWFTPRAAAVGFRIASFDFSPTWGAWQVDPRQNRQQLQLRSLPRLCRGDLGLLDFPAPGSYRLR